MATWIAFIYVIPLILVLWLSWWPMPNRLGVVLQIVAVIGVTLAVASASMWEPVVVWWTVMLASAVIVLIWRSAKKWPVRRLPDTPYGWLGAFILLLIAAASVWVACVGMMVSFWPAGLDLGSV